MAKCELTVVREQGDPTYRGGEPMRGHVVVRVDADCRCDGLTIRPAWRTHGRGNTATGQEAAAELFRGQWSAGEEHSYPFELPAPGYPWTYHGQEMNLDWALVARADIPWALDPKGDEEVVVVPGDDTIDAEVALQRGVHAHKPGQGGLCLALFGLVFAVPGLGIMGGGVVALARGNFGGVMMLPFGGIFAAVGLGVMFLGLRNRLAQMRLGAVELSVEPGRLRPGEAVTCTVRLAPKSDIELNGVTMTLHGREQVVRGSGTNRRTFTHDMHKVELVVADSKRSVRRLEDLQFEHTFRLPEDAAYSLAVSDNTVLWSVSVHVDVAGWPDWTEERPLLVLP